MRCVGMAAWLPVWRRATKCVILGALVAIAPGSSQAECRVTPGAEGEVATWLQAGPVARRPLRRGETVEAQLASWISATAIGATHPSSGGAVPGVQGRWRAVARDADRFRMDEADGRGARDGWLGLEVRSVRDQRVWLFAGSDDGFAVFLDGHEVRRRAGVHEALDDDEAIALDLSAGTHALTVALHVNGGAMRWYARFVDAMFRPPEGLTIALPGVDDATCDDLARAAQRVAQPVTVVASGIEVAARVSYPGGTAHREAETSRAVRLLGPDGRVLAQTSVTLDGRAMADTTLAATVPDETGEVRLEVAVGEPMRVSTRVPDTLRRALRRASTVLDPLDEARTPAWLPVGSLTSARYVASRLAGLVAAHDGDAAHLAEEAVTLERLVADIEHARDPYASLRGPIRRGYRSEIDGALQGYSVYVPASYRADRPFPLVVALHGLAGTAHRMLPVLFGLYDEHEDREHADRHPPPLPDIGAILVAPFGYGDAGYRGPGEADVMAVLDEVRRAYRTDATRTYITGLSMGGIGAAAIPLHHPGVFAAAAPLCGYHSYFVRHDTEGVRQPWELFLMEARSNASWAENGLHLPLYVVHGTLDRPIENSRVLVDRYATLGYDIASEWPELGHNVWTTTYAGGRIVPRFLRYRRDASPRHVRLHTASLRFRESDWVAIDALAARDRWGDVDATVDSAGVRVATQGVRACTLSPPATLFPSASGGTSAAPVDVAVRIDGDTVPMHPGQALSLARGEDQHWHAVATRVSDAPIGPVRDVFDAPIVVVVGTHDPAERAMDDRVAAAWARIHGGIRAHIPVMTDDAVTPDIARTHHLVLVGSPQANSYLARVQSRLPIQVSSGAVHLGARTFAGEQVGSVFAAPNPEVPDRALLVITGTGALGVWRSRFLPELVPDYMVFDEHVAPARGRVILGPVARVLAAGFWP